MPDLDQSTLFGEQKPNHFVRWPRDYGYHQHTWMEYTLLGQVSHWKLYRWPEDYGASAL
jgi:hypothetical protein